MVINNYFHLINLQELYRISYHIISIFRTNGIRNYYDNLSRTEKICIEKLLIKYHNFNCKLSSYLTKMPLLVTLAYARLFILIKFINYSYYPQVWELNSYFRYFLDDSKLNFLY